MHGKRTDDHEYLPLFVYGSLLVEMPDGVEVERREPAIAPGFVADASRPFPVAIFDEATGAVDGELVWLRQASYAKSLTRLDSYEDVPRLFRRVRVNAETEAGVFRAHAYEWVGETWQAYSEAARNKIAIAEYHLQRLHQELASPSDRIGIQAHFEGVLHATIAASDQLAEAINIRLELHLTRPNLLRASEAMAESELKRELSNWIKNPIGPDLKDLRVRATHHFYWKSQGGPRLMVQPPIGRIPYGGSRDLLQYTTAVVAYAAALDELISRFEESA